MGWAAKASTTFAQVKQACPLPRVFPLQNGFPRPPMLTPGLDEGHWV